MSRAAALARSRPQEFGYATTVLAVGDSGSLVSAGSVTPPSSAVTFASFDEVTPAFVRNIGPEMVVSALLSRSFDCIDLAQRLAEIGFTGRYLVLSDGIPDPKIIRREILSLYPDMDVEVASSLERSTA